MNSQAFLWISALFIGGTIAAFLIGRKGYMQPSRLNLKATPKSDFGKSSVVAFQHSSNSPEVRSVESQRAEDMFSGGGARAKNLNVLFMFNGHHFDAFEVLGLPAGSKPQMVDQAFARAISNSSDPNSKVFLETAYAAIKQDRKTG